MDEKLEAATFRAHYSRDGVFYSRGTERITEKEFDAAMARLSGANTWLRLLTGKADDEA